MLVSFLVSLPEPSFARLSQKNQDQRGRLSIRLIEGTLRNTDTDKKSLLGGESEYGGNALVYQGK